ncbi:MAG: DUF3750 domain-containing protein [Kangiellaceae bacterium]
MIYSKSLVCLKKVFTVAKNYLMLAFCSTLIAGCAIDSKLTAGKLAPESSVFEDAVIQVYSARTWGAKKLVSVHTWISVKPQNSEQYTSYEIIGWRLKRRGSALVVRTNQPDRDWWGHQPTLLLDIRGEKAEALIPQIVQAVDDYPHKNNYQAWPGPNSNTFTAFIGRQVPGLGLDLPSTAIGKDYREIADIVGMSASGTGIQASLWGLLGISIGLEEGLELNVLGLNFELDLFDLAIELPGIGRIGADEVDQQKLPKQSHTSKINTSESLGDSN